MYSVHPSIYLQFSFSYNEPTNANNLYPGKAGQNYKVNFDCLFVFSRALKLNKNMNMNESEK